MADTTSFDLHALIHHLEHVLPGQASLADFVHHNTLHGYQALKFPAALKAAGELTGARSWPPESQSRAQLAAGRIERADLVAALDATVGDAEAEVVAGVTRRDLLLASFEHDLAPLDPAQLRWQAEEQGSLASAALWLACLAATGAEWQDIEPEEEVGAGGTVAWDTLAGRLGRDLTLGALLAELTGEDIREQYRPVLIRHLAAHLDLGLASWANPVRDRGFYAAWRAAAADDPAWSLDGLSAAPREIAALPADAAAAIGAELARLGLPEDRRAGYLERLALELPGWSGMFLWRHLHPHYDGSAAPVGMADYLAVRLVFERLHADALCLRRYGVPARLPELAGVAPVLEKPAPWPAACTRAWPLFRLAQALGLPAQRIDADSAAALLTTLEALDADARGHVWLLAYERNYRERILAGLAANHGRCALPAEPPQAQLVFCMDDREEGTRRHLEEIAPRVETLGGAAHFAVFQNYTGLDDEKPTPLCPVAPAVIVPSHNVREVPRDEKVGAGDTVILHRSRHARLRRWRAGLQQNSRRGLFGAALTSALAAPFALAGLLWRSLSPRGFGDFALARQEAYVVPLPTRLELTARMDDNGDAGPATPEAPRDGFTDAEQAERIGNYLTAIGLTRNFAPLVAIMGHGSNSQNNPHLAAYDCGACAGRHSGPNARLFAAMANRPAVRALLAARGTNSIVVPESTWFLGAEHNTCDDRITWYDREDVPAALQPALAELDTALAQAIRAHAQERCRRLFSAPLDISPEAALAHVRGRRHDWSQARPELGHATNACAFIGRRAMSRGAFFDRRSFLISYDPANDPEGLVLERHLLINGAVGAGISLEYFFSTANNAHFGCGSKIAHNVAGYLGVMQGAASDLATGLPRQMIEVHEAMRLLVVVEQNIDLITAIYRRQPPLQELVGNGWVIVAAKDPDSGAIHLFDPQQGWQSWDGRIAAGSVPTVEQSHDWFAGRRGPLPPALLERPLRGMAA
jgi:uncharacterized protein YbcC (UPF0753/DUF2309 family)